MTDAKTTKNNALRASFYYYVRLPRLPGNRADPQRCHVKAWPGDQGRGADDHLHRDLELAAYCNGDVTVTLSKVAVPSAPALWAQVNRPIVTGSVNEIVVVPTWVQVVPSAEE